MILLDQGTVYSQERTVFCPSCGQENPAQARFCGTCGSILNAAATATPPVAAPPAVRYAGFWMRFAAAIIDSVIVVVGLVFVLAVRVFSPFYFVGFLNFVEYLFYLVVFFALPLLYYVLLTGLRGQTLGKMALGVKVIGEDGQAPGLGYAALRETVGKIVSTIALFLGFLWIAWEPGKRGWHDYIAGTHVIKTRG